MTEKFIYLDFDGVLHPNVVEKKKLFSFMPKLAEVLTGDSAKIVISSSWRFHESFEYIKNLFPLTLQSMVVGCTGDAYFGRWARWNEIKQHVSTHCIEEWIALDDAQMEFPPNCENLILCDGKKGLQDDQLRRLSKWLEI